MMTDCIFCKIAKGEMNAEVIHDDPEVVVFKDVHPKAPVHLLVVPKRHIASIAHLAADHRAVISKLIYTAKDVAEGQGLEGYKLIFNVGREGGQVIDHLHLHVLGGWRSDADRTIKV